MPSAIVKKIQFDQKQNLEIILDRKPNFKAYNLHNPERIVVDIENAIYEDGAARPSLPWFVAGFRHSKVSGDLRLVFDLKEKTPVQSSVFQKLKKDKFGKILIKVKVDSSNKGQSIIEEKNSVSSSDKNGANSANSDIATQSSLEPIILAIINEKDPQEDFSSENPVKYVVKKEGEVILSTANQSSNKSQQKPVPKKIPIIAIDAGHGGKDPGTIGDYARTKEKLITLSYAKELGRQLMKTKNYKVYLIRDTDIFVPLRKRVEKARRLNADLFISLHANSAADRNVSGFSIYTLSEKSSDKQAELLAQKENRADIIAGVNFGDTSGDILKTLIDLSQRSSMNSSSQFANIAIKSVQKYDVEILQNTHRFAGFAVLTAPDMASILIELGYLSNRQEEVNLNSITHKRNIVKGLVDAIDEYFRIN